MRIFYFSTSPNLSSLYLPWYAELTEAVIALCMYVISINRANKVVEKEMGGLMMSKNEIAAYKVCLKVM